MCINYRYAQRHDALHKKEADSVFNSAKVTSRTADLKKTGSVKGKTAPGKAKTGSKKDSKADGDPENKQKNAEAEKKMKELEIKRRRAENLTKSSG